LQGTCTALAKRELHWYLPNQVQQIPTETPPGASSAIKGEKQVDVCGK